MGDPKKQRRKFKGPSHPWEKLRIEEEAVLVKEYCLKNKKEVWRAKTKLKHYSDLAKKFVGRSDQEATKEGEDFVTRLYAAGFLEEGANINDVLSANVKAFLERRLQTIVFRKGLAHSMKQARQFITHGHIGIGNKKITVPSFMVKRDEEELVSFAQNSPLANTEHPERIQPETVGNEEVVKEVEEPKESKDKPEEKPKPKGGSKK